MDYEAVGKSCISSGTSLLALGAFLTSLGWFLLATYKETNEWLERWRWLKYLLLRQTTIFLAACVLLITGPRMIGEGGTLTTKGWDLLRSHEQKKALIIAVAKEWELNQIYINQRPLHFDANDEKVGEMHYCYPRFKTSALNMLLASNLIDLHDKNDRELGQTVCNYDSIAASCNTLFGLLDAELIQGATKEHRKSQYNALSNSSPLYVDFRARHEKMGRLLKKRYNWALAEAEKLFGKLQAEQSDK